MEKKSIVLDFEKLLKIISCQENKEFILMYYGLPSSKVKALNYRPPIPIEDIIKHERKKKGIPPRVPFK